jgi:hypothetical protein
VQCVDVTERLLDSTLGTDPEVDEHVSECLMCAHLARGLGKLENVLATTLIVVPPLDLQRQLAQLALEAARPKSIPWWQRLGELNVTNLLAQRPQMIAAQGLAAVMLVLASWQIFGWLNAFQPVVGDVAYAMELVAASPAGVYLSGTQIDLQSLGLWSLVGIGGWLISEDGLLGRRITSLRLRLP